MKDPAEAARGRTVKGDKEGMEMKRLFSFLLCATICLFCFSAMSFSVVAEGGEGEPEIVNFRPEANGELLLEITDLSKEQKNDDTGAVYTQDFGNPLFYAYHAENGRMTSIVPSTSEGAQVYGGKTNLLLGGASKYTVSYLATACAMASGGGVRISFEDPANSIGFYAAANQACLAWGNYTTRGYSGYIKYDDNMKANGTVFYREGFAKFDLEINGYVISGYVNDVLLFREDIRNPSCSNPVNELVKDFMSETLTIVWGEWVGADKTVGEVSTEIKNLKIYSGLLHQEDYTLSALEMQTGATVDGKRTVRFVAGGLSEDYSAAGMEIIASTIDGIRVFTYETRKVVRKLTASETDTGLVAITASENEFVWLIGYTLSEIPEEIGVEFTVRPYVLTGGSKMYGVSKTFTVGDLPLNLTNGEYPLPVHFSEFGFPDP